MLHGEDINTYTNRVEKLYYKLIDINTAVKDEKESKTIHDLIKNQSLAIFIKGLIRPIQSNRCRRRKYCYSKRKKKYNST